MEWSGVDIPLTVTTTRAPAVLKPGGRWRFTWKNPGGRWRFTWKKNCGRWRSIWRAGWSRRRTISATQCSGAGVRLITIDHNCCKESPNQITSSYGAPYPAWWRKLAATQVCSLDFLWWTQSQFSVISRGGFFLLRNQLNKALFLNIVFFSGIVTINIFEMERKENLFWGVNLSKRKQHTVLLTLHTFAVALFVNAIFTGPRYSNFILARLVIQSRGTLY